ncbi:MULTISPECIES: DUF1674 domain-containing protein [unclassified Beijerinckia]|uniref:DUF1674 domain-containing protein n=1 Tax=unclassified Beijerinckia TaxID=2638183 RepID=UPI0008978436|nr:MULTISPECIES: DUF1674 domain-containing protein [unclassified Beijerinckia]MDH7799490.1 hypothetical protein [Beijerinckia sp. GAS462]SED52288.1 hypothetical protein SAMN05443249_5608 [Beijerinckia sp. 28-YEA-48]
MTEPIEKSESVAAQAEPRKPLSAAAQRALAEAQERRRQAEATAKAEPVEINGRGGLDPVRYGDWESKGITSDF